MAELYTARLTADTVRLVEDFPRIEVIPSPRPGRDIAVLRTLSRIHVHTPTMETSSAILFLLRLSDQSFLGGTVIDWNHGGPLEVQKWWAEHEFNFDPHYFRLKAGDSFLVVSALPESHGALRPVEISQNILIAYALFRPEGTLE